MYKVPSLTPLSTIDGARRTWLRMLAFARRTHAMTTCNAKKGQFALGPPEAAEESAQGHRKRRAGDSADLVIC
jgi:hypothetical protein